jgi:hypothetical protein
MTSRLDQATSRGFMLIDCLVYLSLLAVVLALAFAAFYQAFKNTRNLTRNAEDIVRVLKAGEGWREDVRAATAPPRLEETGAETILRLPRHGGDVRYTFRAGAVLRQPPGTEKWLPVLDQVKTSRMQLDRRQRAAAWRWELELQGRPRAARIKPVFTFYAVNAANPAP